MKEIKKIILAFAIGFCSINGHAQDKTKLAWYGNTSIGLSIYHFGGYTKQRPIYSLEQTFEIAPFEKIRFGLGTGFNLYPAALTIPVYATVKYLITSKEKWFCSVSQSYGRNIKMGKIGFSSNRYTGNIGNSLKVSEKLWIQSELGYLLNWDKYGGGSLSLSLNFGISYKI